MSRVAELRAAKGLTQRQLAWLVNVTEATLRSWEHGGSVPHPRHRRILAKQLGVAVGELGFPVAEPGGPEPPGL